MTASFTYRLPAEWEKHEGTILCWPTIKSDWPGKYIPIHWVYGEIIKKISRGEQVILLVQDAKQKEFVIKLLTKVGVDLNKVTFHLFPTDRSWMRDSAPPFVLDKTGKRKLVHVRFNGWAKYDNWKLDARLQPFLSKKLKIDAMQGIHNTRHVVLEGGSIDTNGQGTMLTTEECLLDPVTQVRNPGFSKKDYEEFFADYFGIRQTIWLNKGILGDDTHGHVDDFCRFVNSDTVVLCREPDKKDGNHALLEENFRRLKNITLCNGKKLKVIPLPLPEPVIFDGMRLPASYANFYITNSYVLVPTFNDPNDKEALHILSRLFKDRKVCGIHAVDLVWGLGTLHCLSHELPAAKDE
jgi:agmatine deiminase